MLPLAPRAQNDLPTAASKIAKDLTSAWAYSRQLEDAQSLCTADFAISHLLSVVFLPLGRENSLLRALIPSSSSEGILDQRVDRVAIEVGGWRRGW